MTYIAAVESSITVKICGHTLMFRVSEIRRVRAAITLAIFDHHLRETGGKVYDSYRLTAIETGLCFESVRKYVRNRRRYINKTNHGTKDQERDDP